MNLFQTTSKVNFTNDVIDYIISDKFISNLAISKIESKNCYDYFYNLTILVPSGHYANYLEKELIKKLGNIILPKILPFNALSASNEEIFTLPSGVYQTLTKLEEQLSLANIIHEYPEFDYNIISSANIAPKLADLFYELEANYLKLEDLSKISNIDDEQNWKNIYKFLKYAFKLWQENISAQNKKSKARHQIEIYEAEINRLKKHPDHHIIVAGVNASNKISWNFLSELAKCANGHIILPPQSYYYPHRNKTNKSFNNVFLLLEKFLEYANLKIENFQKLGNIDISKYSYFISNHFDYLSPTLQNENDTSNKAQYIEFENIYDEANFLSSKLSEIIAHNPNCSINIIINNKASKWLYLAYLDKMNICYSDLGGRDIRSSPGISILRAIASFTHDYINGEFNLKNLLSIYTHPACLSQEKAILIEQICSRVDPFVNDPKKILQIIYSNKLPYDVTNESLADFFRAALQNLTYLSNKPSINFSEYILNLIRAAEIIYPNIWINELENNLASAIDEMYNSCKDYQHFLSNSLEIKYFFDFFNLLLTGITLNNTNSKSNIMISSIALMPLANFDYNFIIDCSDHAYPKQLQENPWISRQAENELGIYFNSNNNELLWNFFYSLDNQNTFITRSKRQISKNNLGESDYVLKLLAKKNQLNKVEFNMHSAVKHNENEQSASIEITLKNYQTRTSAQFPSKLYASDIEMLINAPYNFYCKKILKLKKSNLLSQEVNLSEYGKFFHEIVENFSKELYLSKAKFSFKEAKELFTAILDRITLSYSIPDNIKILWKMKLMSLADEFIDFELSRKSNIDEVLLEAHGTIARKIGDHNIEISAIADRIEFTADGNINIIDYKTGTAPSISKVKSGLAPQLIIEAIILLNGGYNFSKDIIYPQKITLTYVKINSSEPYIKETNIELSIDEIENIDHKITNLIDHYINTKIYDKEICNITYDDYWHLARRKAY